MKLTGLRLPFSEGGGMLRMRNTDPRGGISAPGWGGADTRDPPLTTPLPMGQPAGRGDKPARWVGGGGGGVVIALRVSFIYFFEGGGVLRLLGFFCSAEGRGGEGGGGKRKGGVKREARGVRVFPPPPPLAPKWPRGDRPIGA